MPRKIRRRLLEGDLEQISSKVFDSYHDEITKYPNRFDSPPRSSFDSYHDEITKLIGKRHGVYALYRKGQLYYVGLAKNLRSRVRQHLRDKHAKKWDTFSLYLIKNVNYLKELESLIVHIAEPQGNVSRGRFARSENLIDALRDLMKEKDEQKREQILTGTIGTPRPRSARKKRPQRAASRRAGDRKPALYGLLPAHTELRVFYKGNERRARTDSQGRIAIGAKRFNSPSLAGNYVRGGKSTNGWTFWRYKNSKGEWVLIDELR